jgi:uncharacterized protein (UPF0262 family)
MQLPILLRRCCDAAERTNAAAVRAPRCNLHTDNRQKVRARTEGTIRHQLQHWSSVDFVFTLVCIMRQLSFVCRRRISVVIN